jgi:Homeodomain-like domain
MPKSPVVEIPPEQHGQMLAALRRARYGYLLALHILLLCAAGRTPTDIAAALYCSRSSVYRTVRAYRKGILGWEQDARGRLLPPCAPRYSSRRCGVRSWRCSRLPHGRMSGAARAGAALLWP